jgi:sugar phosphate isomerase/epimerase
LETEVADQVLLSATQKNLPDCIRLAQEQELGIELMTFAYPDVLDGDWKSLTAQYRMLLRDVPGMLAMHGPFMDMASGSPDRRINLVCIERYQHAIRIAAEVGIELVVFHANFIAAIHTDEYRMSWHRRNLTFWTPMADYARQHGVTIAVENMWEFDPTIIGDVVSEIAHPNLKICLDVGHAHLFGEVEFGEWLSVLEPIIVHTHLNNNNGKVDMHHAFSDGVLDYHDILPRLRALKTPPSMTLEMDEVSMMEASLPYMELVPVGVTPPVDS